MAKVTRGRENKRKNRGPGAQILGRHKIPFLETIGDVSDEVACGALGGSAAGEFIRSGVTRNACVASYPMEGKEIPGGLTDEAFDGVDDVPVEAVLWFAGGLVAEGEHPDGILAVGENVGGVDEEAVFLECTNHVLGGDPDCPQLTGIVRSLAERDPIFEFLAVGGGEGVGQGDGGPRPRGAGVGDGGPVGEAGDRTTWKGRELGEGFGLRGFGLRLRPLAGLAQAVGAGGLA